MMLRQAPIGNAVEHTNVGGGFLLRLWAWFTGDATSSNIAVNESHDIPASNIVSRDVILRENGLRGVSPTEACDEMVRTGTLLPFPIRGEALLVKLAEQLRRRVASNKSKRGSFLLTLSRHPHSRLTIDGAAHVNFHSDSATFHLVIELVQDTRIMVETSDFDTVVKFVVQYVVDRLEDAIGPEDVL